MLKKWIPAFAGMTILSVRAIPADRDAALGVAFCN